MPRKKNQFARPNHQLISNSRATWATSTPHTPLYSLRSWKQLCLAYRLAFVIYPALHNTTVQSLVQKKFSQTNLKIKAIPKKKMIHLSRLKLHMAMILEGRRIESELGKKEKALKNWKWSWIIVQYCSGSFLFLNKPRHPCGAPFLDTKRFLFAKLFCQQKMSMCTISFPKKASISAAFGRAGLQWSEHLCHKRHPFLGSFLKYKIKSLWCWEYLCHKRCLFQGH